jgi:hypothetical protein
MMSFVIENVFLMTVEDMQICSGLVNALFAMMAFPDPRMMARAVTKS